MDAKFEKIIEEAIEKARKIKCSIPEYLSGLQTMSDRIREEISAANEM